MSGWVILAMNNRLPMRAWYLVLLHLGSSRLLVCSKGLLFVGSDVLLDRDCDDDIE